MYKKFQCDDGLILSKTCTITGKHYSIKVDNEDYMKWKGGELIQNVFSSLSPEQREFIMSGTTPAEWNNMFKVSEDFWLCSKCQDSFPMDDLLPVNDLLLCMKCHQAKFSFPESL
jgi:formylmethanofuran dehydrogenase subunit E